MIEAIAKFWDRAKFSAWLGEAETITITPRQYSDDYYGRDDLMVVGQYPSLHRLEDWELACLHKDGVPYLRICVKNE